VFGLAGLPALGLPGAALATIIGHAVSLAYLLNVLLRGTSRLQLTLRGYRPDPQILKQLVKIGWPASVNGMERMIAQLSFGVLVAPFGDLAYAAFTVTRRVEMFAHMGSMGLGMAAGTIAGQSLGAGKPARAKQTVLWACAFGFLINAVLSILMFLFPDAFLSLFAREPEFLDSARAWLFIMLFGYAALGGTMAMAQAFQMAGDTFIVMLVNLATLWSAVPLAFLLSRGTPLGELGIAWAMVVPMLIRPFVFFPYFYWGRWLRIRLFTSEPIPVPAADSGRAA
jgi:putative MATE family efflux protein